MDTAAPSLAPANPDIRDSSSPISPQQSSIFRRSTRRKKLPSYLKDYHCNLHQSVPQSNLSSHQFQLLQVILILYQRFFHMNLYPLLIKPFLSNSLRILNQEAMKKLHDTTCWQQAMAAEFHALQANNTWELVNLPPNKKAIGCK